MSTAERYEHFVGLATMARNGNGGNNGQEPPNQGRLANKTNGRLSATSLLLERPPPTSTIPRFDTREKETTNGCQQLVAPNAKCPIPNNRNNSTASSNGLLDATFSEDTYHTPSGGGNFNRFVPSGSATLDRHSRLFCKETVPTALVSPQTVQITVQPPPATDLSPLQQHHQNQPAFFRHSFTMAQDDRSGGRYLFPVAPMQFQNHQNGGMVPVSDVTFSTEPVVYRSKIKSASVVLPSFSCVDPAWAMPTSSSGGSMLLASGHHNNNNKHQVFLGPAQSDERLELLEQRMRLLESRLTTANSSGRTTPTPTHSASMRELYTTQQVAGGALVAANEDYSDERIRYLQEQIEQDLDVRNKARSSNRQSWKDREIEALKKRLRDLEMENDSWKSRYEIKHSTPTATYPFKRNSYYDEIVASQASSEYENFPITGGASVAVKPSSSMGDLAPNSPAPNEPRPPGLLSAPHTPPPSLSLGHLLEHPAPDQYVPMQRYRLLKAKSKKLLADKSEAYRTEKQEKESLLVQLQLQNKELSELRNKVYKMKNHENGESSLADLAKKFDEVLRSLKNCTFASACILGICRDISDKKCPDYDQILGLKADGLSSSMLKRSFSSNLSEKFDNNNGEKLVQVEQMNELVKLCNENLTEVQKLIVDYYTNELVDSIDCRLQ